jgi:hypothetical protein
VRPKCAPADRSAALGNSSEADTANSHLLWEQRVAGSNPVSPTIFHEGKSDDPARWESEPAALCIHRVYTALVSGLFWFPCRPMPSNLLWRGKWHTHLTWSGLRPGQAQCPDLPSGPLTSSNREHNGIEQLHHDDLRLRRSQDH